MRVEHGPHDDLLEEALGGLEAGDVVPADRAAGANDLVAHELDEPRVVARELGRQLAVDRCRVCVGCEGNVFCCFA